jgi:hypothetical protein
MNFKFSSKLLTVVNPGAADTEDLGTGDKC